MNLDEAQAKLEAPIAEPSLPILSQSRAKKINEEFTCPRKYKAYHVDKLFETPASPYMLQGHYFEYCALGNPTRDGVVPEMPLLRSGEKSTMQLRIEAQAKEFRRQGR